MEERSDCLRVAYCERVTPRKVVTYYSHKPMVLKIKNSDYTSAMQISRSLICFDAGRGLIPKITAG
jgi:hypothetical protein